uniref:Reverse transcriptase domain-containing protein n=1 Tax=Tanacetum cinerariifolium TaxID=118510 RepID=A0A6L2LPF6_TANCI|nr:reverse transcriptase domain-containing protein [Tanacetum cinerariifolium]
MVLVTTPGQLTGYVAPLRIGSKGSGVGSDARANVGYFWNDKRHSTVGGSGPPHAGSNLQNPPVPDLRPMEELLQAPAEGIGKAIVVPPVLANQFELKIGLLNLVTAISFHGFGNDDPHSHIRSSLADSGESINLMPLLIYEKLRIRSLKPTRMTLELANRSVTYSLGIAEDVIVKVDKFNFLADFVIVDFEADLRVPIILGRPFLHTVKDLIDLYEEKLTLRIGNEELVFRAEHFSKNSPSREGHSVYSIDIIDSPCEEISNQNQQSSGSTTSHSDLSLPDYESFNSI